MKGDYAIKNISIKNLILIGLLLVTLSACIPEGSTPKLLFIEEDTSLMGTGQGRAIGDMAIFEGEQGALMDSQSGTVNNVLRCFDLKQSQMVAEKTLSPKEQKNYAGIRIIDEHNTDIRIMIKYVTGVSFFHENLEPIKSEGIEFPQKLIEELIATSDGAYFNHFDVTADGRYVYYTDGQKLFRFDIQDDKSSVIMPELEIIIDANPPRELVYFSHWISEDEIERRMSQRLKLACKLYNLLLAPNDEFLLMQVGGYKNSFFVYNIGTPDKSFLIDDLPFIPNWSNIQNIIPLYSGTWAEAEEKQELHPHLESNIRTFVAIQPEDESVISLDITDIATDANVSVMLPLGKNRVADGYDSSLLAAFNSDYICFINQRNMFSKEKKVAEYEYQVFLWDNKREQSSLIFQSNDELKVDALLQGGQVIIRQKTDNGVEHLLVN